MAKVLSSSIITSKRMFRIGQRRGPSADDLAQCSSRVRVPKSSCRVRTEVSIAIGRYRGFIGMIYGLGFRALGYCSRMEHQIDKTMDI